MRSYKVGYKSLFICVHPESLCHLEYDIRDLYVLVNQMKEWINEWIN